MVKIIYGNEPYLIKYAQLTFMSYDTSENAANTKKYTSFEEAYEFVSSYSFFGDVRVAIVTVPQLKDLDTKLFKEYIMADPAQTDAEFLNADQCILIKLDESRINQKTKLYKEISPYCCIQKYDKLNDRQLKEILDNFLKKYGLKMEPSVKKFFLERLNYTENEEVSLFTLRNELEMLGSLSKTITVPLIADNVPNYAQANSFFLITKIRNKNMDGLIQELEKLEREKGFSAIKTLALLSREYNIAYKLCLGFQSSEIGASSTALNNVSSVVLLNGMVIINSCVHNIKQGIMDEKQALRYACCQLVDDMV